MVSGPAARSTNINTPFRPRSLLGRGPPSVAREGIAAAGGPCPSGNTDSVSLVTPSQQTSDIMSVRRRLGEKQVYDIIFLYGWKRGIHIYFEVEYISYYTRRKNAGGPSKGTPIL